MWLSKAILNHAGLCIQTCAPYWRMAPSLCLLSWRVLGAVVEGNYLRSKPAFLWPSISTWKLDLRGSQSLNRSLGITSGRSKCFMDIISLNPSIVPLGVKLLPSHSHFPQLTIPCFVFVQTRFWIINGVIYCESCARPSKWTLNFSGHWKGTILM